MPEHWQPGDLALCVIPEGCGWVNSQGPATGPKRGALATVEQVHLDVREACGCSNNFLALREYPTPVPRVIGWQMEGFFRIAPLSVSEERATKSIFATLERLATLRTTGAYASFYEPQAAPKHNV